MFDILTLEHNEKYWQTCDQLRYPNELELNEDLRSRPIIKYMDELLVRNKNFIYDVQESITYNLPLVRETEKSVTCMSWLCARLEDGKKAWLEILICFRIGLWL